MPPAEEFYRIKKLPPYVFAVINELRDQARATGIDILDMGMGNPDGASPQPVVEKMIAEARNPLNHRYSVSRGIAPLRQAIVNRYAKRYGVQLDPESEAIVTVGAKDALAHMLLAVIGPGDTVVSPNPAYPIHQYGVIMAEGEAHMLPMPDAATFLQGLKDYYKSASKAPKLILISFPHNPTTVCVDLDFMREMVALAAQHGTYIIHDFAYADLGFDGYKPPSILEIPGATDYAVEIYSMTKSFNMAGWRVAYAVGNRRLIAALTRMKSYLDYGIFQPIQIASVVGLNECEDAPAEICAVYQHRRDVLVAGLHSAGWLVEPPKATMFLWTRIPEAFRDMGSLEFAKTLMRETQVAVSPGIGFGPMGEGHVRFSLIEEDDRVKTATSRIGTFFGKHGMTSAPVPEPAHV